MESEVERSALSVSEFADLMCLILIEVAAEFTASSEEADQSLENVGSRFLDVTAKLSDPRLKAIMACVTETLVRTERS